MISDCQLPVTPYLDAICDALAASPSRFLVLTAETAAGKSTAVPSALLGRFPGRILMLEPRRLAVLAIANRISELHSEPTGKTIGYRMHLESKISSQTRLEVITEAILTRKIQADPLLEGIDVVIIDEFHERSVHEDLGLAFLKETMQLRDDLYVLVMSATIDTEQVAAYLGTGTTPAPVFKVPGRQFPVTITYAGTISPSQAVLNELRRPGTDRGSILVFLPGIGDIHRCAAELASHTINADIQLLHSSISFSEQKKVLDPPVPGSRRRIILSSAIAETSLTVPGVTTIIDSGLARISRMNISCGMEQLVTEPESVFSAVQRAGRAGRTAPGTCIRLWSENDVRTSATPPEILRTDLAPVVLECAQWGIQNPEQLSWLDVPPRSAWDAAQSLLETLGCLDTLKHITPTGSAVLTLGVHPRIACAALAGFFLTQTENNSAAQNDMIRQAVQSILPYTSYRDTPPAVQKRFCMDLTRRIRACVPTLHQHADDRNLRKNPSSIQTAVLLGGFPDRLAHHTDTPGVYRFPSGRLARLPENERQNSSSFPEWIVAPEADAGERTGRIYRYEAVNTEEAEQWLESKTRTVTETVFDPLTGKTHKTEFRKYGSIVLSSKKIKPDTQDYVEAVCRAVEKNGIGILPVSADTDRFLLRAAFGEQQTTGGNKTSRGSLSRSVREWLPPFLPTDGNVTAKIVYESLRWYLDGQNVDKNVPQHITLPNGRSYKLSFEQQQTADGRKLIRPVLEIIIQQIFGCFETPRVLGVPVLLRLLSPARRPLQITDDLAGFWQTTWPEICREMKGRYPKHNWNYRIPEENK